MKAFLSIVMACCISIAVNSQEPDSLMDENKADTTNLMLGKKKITIVENDGETDIKVTDRDKKEEREEITEEVEVYEETENNNSNNDDNSGSWSRKKSNKHFKGHWDAFQIGINSYVTSDMSTSLPDNMDFMSLNTNKSINVNLNMFQQSFGIIGRSLGMITGLGLEFTNYVFDGNNSIEKDATGYIVPTYPPYKLDKSKLTTSYLTVPLLLEFQFPGNKRSNRLYMNAGVVGGIKLGSKTKIKYKENGDKQDKKNKNDFNLNALRYGFTGRIGIKHLSIYGTYYPVALFEKNKGPELYPFMVGFSFDGF